MKNLLYISACIAASSAAPTLWTPEMAAVYSETANIIQSRAARPAPSCDLSQVDIVAYLATIPNAPAVVAPGNAKLVEVTLGRGIQNYTCADNSSSTIPKAIGAVANLYNVSCIAANYPNLLSLMPPFAVQYNTTLDAQGQLMGLGIKRSGNHFFTAAGNPFFDLNDDPHHQLGVITGDGKNAAMKVAAPTTATKGQILAQNGQTGAVAWLKLNPMNGTLTTDGLTTVYRVVTAGGSAPATCAGQPSLISVQYAAQYWFFVSPNVTSSRI